MQDPPRTTRIEGLAALNSATFAASSYVLPPTINTNMSDGLFAVLGFTRGKAESLNLPFKIESRVLLNRG